MTQIESQRDSGWVTDETLENVFNVGSYLHKHKKLSVCVPVVMFCCSGDAFACAGKERERQDNRNAEIIKSLQDGDGWPNRHTLAPSPLLCQAVMCIVYLHNHLPFILSRFSPSPSLTR